MKTSFRIITEEIRQPIYIANDGITFDSEAECLAHEQAVEKIAELQIPNPKSIFPYSEWIDTDLFDYIWLDLKTEDDIRNATNAYEISNHSLKIGLNCIEVGHTNDNYVYDVNDSINNAIALLDFVGYDTSALKRKENT